jgi:hypothetical protein
MFRAGMPSIVDSKGESFAVSRRLDRFSFLSNEFPLALPPGDRCTPLLDFKVDECSRPAVFSPSNHVLSVPDGEGFSKVSPFDEGMSDIDCPATRALDKICDLNVSRMACTIVNSPGHKKMIQRTSLKRSRTSGGLLDFSDIIEATQPVIESIAFPTIEWSFTDDGDANDDVDVTYPFFRCRSDGNDVETMEPPSAKRRCRGLFRSRQLQSNLHLLDNDIG